MYPYHDLVRLPNLGCFYRLSITCLTCPAAGLAAVCVSCRGFGDLWSGTNQSGKGSLISKVTLDQLNKDPNLMQEVWRAAGELLQTLETNVALKSALLMSGIMYLPEGEDWPVARHGISGI